MPRDLELYFLRQYNNTNPFWIVQSAQITIGTTLVLTFRSFLNSLATSRYFYLCAYQCKAGRGGGGGRQGMGGGFDCLCWPWGRAFGQSCYPGGGAI